MGVGKRPPSARVSTWSISSRWVEKTAQVEPQRPSETIMIWRGVRNCLVLSMEEKIRLTFDDPDEKAEAELT